jgi:hypothetical protein
MGGPGVPARNLILPDLHGSDGESRWANGRIGAENAVWRVSLPETRSGPIRSAFCPNTLSAGERRKEDLAEGFPPRQGRLGASPGMEHRIDDLERLH